MSSKDKNPITVEELTQALKGIVEHMNQEFSKRDSVLSKINEFMDSKSSKESDNEGEPREP